VLSSLRSFLYFSIPLLFIFIFAWCVILCDMCIFVCCVLL
jgi:hypothetical protein